MLPRAGSTQTGTVTTTFISAADARRRLAEGGVVLIDIREPAEHAREHITGRLAPLSKLDVASLAQILPPGSSPVFYCQSGSRTRMNTTKLADCVSGDCFVLEGGLSAWKRAGGTTRVDRSQPIELMRQVQIAAGSLVLLGLALAAFVSPAWAALSAFIGAGLLFAGISGWCGMARLLALMPWNRPRGM
jgi:rhodanese-related sulfurtransferase